MTVCIEIVARFILCMYRFGVCVSHVGLTVDSFDFLNLG